MASPTNKPWHEYSDDDDFHAYPNEVADDQAADVVVCAEAHKPVDVDNHDDGCADPQVDAQAVAKAPQPPKSVWKIIVKKPAVAANEQVASGEVSQQQEPVQAGQDDLADGNSADDGGWNVVMNKNHQRKKEKNPPKNNRKDNRRRRRTNTNGNGSNGKGANGNGANGIGSKGGSSPKNQGGKTKNKGGSSNDQGASNVGKKEVQARVEGAAAEDMKPVPAGLPKNNPWDMNRIALAPPSKESGAASTSQGVDAGNNTNQNGRRQRRRRKRNDKNKKKDENKGDEKKENVAEEKEAVQKKFVFVAAPLPPNSPWAKPAVQTSEFRRSLKCYLMS